MIDPVDVPLNRNTVEQSVQYITSLELGLLDDNIRTVEQQISKGEMGPEAWQIVWQARLFRCLDDQGLLVVDEFGNKTGQTWHDVVTDHRGFIESLIFEMEIAALLTAFDKDVAFVHGSGETKAPDLLVDGDLWVECKMRQLEKDVRRWDQIKDKLLDEVITPNVKATNVIHSFTVSFTEPFDRDNIDSLQMALRQMIDQEESRLDQDQYTISRSIQSITLAQAKQILQIDPEFHTDPHGRKTKISVYANDNGDITEFVGAEIQFELVNDWYYPKKIRNRVKEAANKNLASKEKSAVFVGIPPAYLNTMVERNTPVANRSPDSKFTSISQLERLDEEIRFRILNQSQTLNIICLYFSGVLNQIAYCPLIQYWENKDCHQPDHEEFAEALKRIQRTYLGHLRMKDTNIST
jgi:uncharacterized protein (UPF0147 family)